MKWMIASDLHGSATFCRDMLRAFEREGAERLLFLGDLLYHGPRNDLPEGYAPKEVIPMLNGIRDVMLCVRGNCDTEVDQMVLEFPIMADYALLSEDGCRMYATHGHIYHAGCLPPVRPGDILLHGHTHVPVWERSGEVRVMNPGSVSIPKGGSARGFMVLENGVFRWKTLDGETWHEEPAR